MRVRNTTQRNILLLARNHFIVGSEKDEAKRLNGQPPRINIPAGATLEVEDTEWGLYAEAAKHLIAKEILVFMDRPTSPLTRSQIIEKVKEVAKVDLNPKASKAELQKKAEQLDVDIWTALEVVEEVEEIKTEEAA